MRVINLFTVQRLQIVMINSKPVAKLLNHENCKIERVFKTGKLNADCVNSADTP